MKETNVTVGVIILAAGKGTRMKSDSPKVLSLLRDRPLLSYVLETARAVNPDRIVIIVGHGRERVMERFNAPDIQFAVQEPQLGTGHAIAQAGPAFKGFKKGLIAALSGDVPLLRPETLKSMIAAQVETGSAITALTCHMENPGSYGRIIRSGAKIVANVEAKDATEKQLAIREINSGIYVFDGDFLFPALKRINNRNAQGEYYLTDLISIAVEEGLTVSGVLASDPAEIQGVNTAGQLADLEKELNGAVER